MDDKQLETLLKDSLQHSVGAQAHVLDGLENRVLEKLDHPVTETAARPWALWFPRVKLTFAFAGTALAALLIGVFIGGYFPMPFNTPAYQGVTFIVAMPEANQVAVVGDFNGWQPASLSRDSNGIWSLKVDLSPGRYEYAFVVDGVAWRPDPRADEYVKSYGFTNSVKYVNAEGETS